MRFTSLCQGRSKEDCPVRRLIKEGDAPRRMMDIVLAGVGLLCVTPLLGVLAVAVRADSEGPALFFQRRVGRGGKVFHICKFRSMRTQHSGVAVSTSDDDRVTRMGRFLRKTKLDELPQLYNVLAGDMSFVGPRPEVPHYAKLWPADVAPTIVSVRPGITDPVAIKYRNEADVLASVDNPEEYYTTVLLPEKARMYADYIHSRSLLSDLKVIAQTLVTVVKD